MDWSTFCLGLVGAAATVTGLLFIAVQINRDVLFAGRNERSRAIAGSTFTMFVLLILIPLVYLIPGLSTKGRAIFSLIIGLFGIVRVVRSWLPVWASMILDGVKGRLLATAWLLIAPIIMYAILAISSYGLLSADETTQATLQTNIAICLVALFSIALRNSWNLIFEVAYQPKPENR